MHLPTRNRRRSTGGDAFDAVLFVPEEYNEWIVCVRFNFGGL